MVNLKKPYQLSLLIAWLICLIFSPARTHAQGETGKRTNGAGAEADRLVKNGEQLLKNGDVKVAEIAFQSAIGKYQSDNNLPAQARTWYRFGMAMLKPDHFYFRNGFVFNRPLNDAYEGKILDCMRKAAVLAGKANVRDLQVMALSHTADSYFRVFKLDSAINVTTRLLPLLRENDPVQSYMLYYALLRMYMLKSEHDKALQFGLLAIKVCEEQHAPYDANVIYSGLGILYYVVKKPAEAIEAFGNYMRLSKQYGRPVDMQNMAFFASALSSVGKGEEAIRYLKAVNIDDPVYGSEKRGDYYKTLAQTYERLNQVSSAESYYTKWLNNLKEQSAPPVAMATANLSMFRFYMNQKNWDKAEEYSKSLLNEPGKTSLYNVRIVHQLQYKLDSVRGNYLSAIRHLQLAVEMDNKISGDATKKRIEELQIGFETEKKDKNIMLLKQEVSLQKLAALAKAKDNELLNASLKLREAETAEKEKGIQLLFTKVRLQQVQTANNKKSIDLLTSQGNLQKASLAKANLVKNSTFIGLAGALVILCLVVSQYRQKQKASKIIERKNDSLQLLVTEKDGLIRDKEWLLKEIHHRVKNNLQIVISLLNTQSAHLDSEIALAALQESQHRMRSISLIHQKLYQSDDVASIDMDDYINDLVAYLKDSFSTGGNIEYDLQIEPILLDVAQAVPVGLILNEAITNSIKYAFGNRKKCRILVALDENIEGIVSLIIADNGCGMPPGFDLTASQSLGMNLIHGLTKQLSGTIRIENKEGLMITLVFHKSLITHDAGILSA